MPILPSKKPWRSSACMLHQLHGCMLHLNSQSQTKTGVVGTLNMVNKWSIWKSRNGIVASCSGSESRAPPALVCLLHRLQLTRCPPRFRAILKTQAIEKNLGAPIIPSWEGCHPINLAKNANRKSFLKLLRAPIVVAQGDGTDG